MTIDRWLTLTHTLFAAEVGTVNSDREAAREIDHASRADKPSELACESTDPSNRFKANCYFCQSQPAVSRDRFSAALRPDGASIHRGKPMNKGM